ncbi:MAG: metalloregulator ArsR/SmtB family transcription factor [Anaerolineales bacterium]
MEDQNHTDAERQADVFSVLSNPKRILILRALAEGELSVGDIAQVVETSMQNASHHLRLMKDKGILTRHRKGQSIFYQIAEPEIVASILELDPDQADLRNE